MPPPISPVAAIPPSARFFGVAKPAFFGADSLVELVPVGTRIPDTEVIRVSFRPAMPDGARASDTSGHGCPTSGYRELMAR
jgi:hypothetical protein